MRSPKLKLFAREKLKTVRRGPRSEFLPSSPNANSPAGVALTKAAVLNHSLGPGLATWILPTTLGNQLQPLLTSPPVAVPPTPQPVIVEFRLSLLTTVNGFPLWATTVPAIRHPPIAAFANALASLIYIFPLPNGSS